MPFMHYPRCSNLSTFKRKHDYLTAKCQCSIERLEMVFLHAARLAIRVSRTTDSGNSDAVDKNESSS